jgi:hypothetical protein
MALENLSRAVSAGVTGVRMQVRVATLPMTELDSPGVDALFDRHFMQRLDSVGFAKARGSSPFDVISSAYVRPVPR